MFSTVGCQDRQLFTPLACTQHDMMSESFLFQKPCELAASGISDYQHKMRWKSLANTWKLLTEDLILMSGMEEEVGEARPIFGGWGGQFDIDRPVATR